MNTDRIAFQTILVATLMSGLVACATPEKHPAIEEARTALTSAEHNTKVKQYAPVPLAKAEAQFKQAETLSKEGADDAEIEHQAYLAKQRAAIAIVEGERHAAEKTIEKARAKRDDLRLQVSKRKAKQAAERAESLEKQIEKLKARKTERGLVLTLSDVLFDFNKAELKPGAYRTVDRLADFLKKNEKRHILIEGFTDSKGSEAYNQRLSERRANTVREALLQRRISASRIRLRGYGEAYPVATNDTPAGRAQNRRVEIIVSDRDGEIPQRTS
jgi:outer membrane protein OmpA-like peptidoglycan-associated protein